MLQGIARPERVKPPLLEFREDHTGDDAVFVTFPVSTRIALTRKRSMELFNFVRQVTDELYQLPMKRISYVRLS